MGYQAETLLSERRTKDAIFSDVKWNKFNHKNDRNMIKFIVLNIFQLIFSSKSILI